MYYTYLIWNKKTKMKYIGYHKDNNDMDIYYGTPSSRKNEKNIEFQRLLKENSSLLKKRVLKWFDNKIDAINHEIEIHKKYDVKNNKMFYNDSNQNTYKFEYDRTGITHTDEARKKMSESQKKIGNKPPNTKEWWTAEHSENCSKRVSGEKNPRARKVVIDNVEYSHIQDAVIKLGIKRSDVYEKIKNCKNSYFIGDQSIPNSYMNEKSGFASGERNAMANPENRKKVSESKIGLKSLIKDNVRKLAKPNSEKWNELVKNGFKPANENIQVRN